MNPTVDTVLGGESDGCVVRGDSLVVAAGMAANCIDTIITDPPYGLKFMGKDWDHGIPGTHFWEAFLRIAKPGAMLLAFGGTRTHHRLMVAIEDAGWEIRDCLMWLYGSGFPKSLDVSKAIDKAAGAERESTGKNPNDREKRTNAMSDYGLQGGVGKGDITAPATDAAKQWEGWGTALKPAYEIIILAMKPLDGTFAQNAQKHGVAGLNIDACRIESQDTVTNHSRSAKSAISKGKYGDSSAQETHQTQGQKLGRWPANLILDEEAGEMLDEQSGQLHSNSGNLRPLQGERNPNIYRGFGMRSEHGRTDSGGASRFFYCAKASRAEREEGCEDVAALVIGHNLSSNACARCGRRVMANGSGQKCECGPDRETVKLPTASRNHHPTVKPLALMEYLCKLTATPTGGIVLDPFMGSGTTGVACVNTGRKFIGIELDPAYTDIAARRIEAARRKFPLFAKER